MANTGGAFDILRCSYFNSLFFLPQRALAQMETVGTSQAISGMFSREHYAAELMVFINIRARSLRVMEKILRAVRVEAV